MCPSWQLAKLIDSSKRASATAKAKATATSTSTARSADADNDVVAAADVDDDAANLVIAASVEKQTRQTKRQKQPKTKAI